MAELATLNAETRTSTGKGVARKLRDQGKLPAVVYGKGLEASALTVEFKEFIDLLNTKLGSNILIKLDVPGSTDLNGKTVMVRDLQRDPLSHTPIHADLIEVLMDQSVTVVIPVRFFGKPAGVEEGGILQESTRSLQVECLPDRIPVSMDFDVSKLNIGDSLHLSDVKLPEGVNAIGDTDPVLAQVLGASVLTAEEAGEVEAEEGEGEEAAEGEEKKEEKTEKAEE